MASSRGTRSRTSLTAFVSIVLGPNRDVRKHAQVILDADDQFQHVTKERECSADKEAAYPDTNSDGDGIGGRARSGPGSYTDRSEYPDEDSSSAF